MSSNHPAITIHDIVETFDGGRVRALAGVDLTVPRGAFVAIVGPSGCGKSTLLHLIAALDRPDSGTILIHGRSLADWGNLSRYRAREVGLVFQLDNLLPSLTASENVQVPMFEMGMSGSERRRRANRLLAQVGLQGKENQRPPQMSGGERQRVAIARALANDPPILLADEPTGRLDSTTGRLVLDLLEELHHQRGLTVVLVTHDQAIAARADQIVRMLDGRIVTEGIIDHAARTAAAVAI
ncbi:MAG: ABC transporter ATP-binding protein [Dehalococcoidia bacterium]